MAGLPITALPLITSATLTDMLPIVQDEETTSRATLLQLRTLFGFNVFSGILPQEFGGTGTVDYFEQDKFIPTLTGSSASPTSITYSSQVGEYFRVGSFIFYKAKVTLSAITMGAASGNLQITGLPSASAADSAPTPGSCYMQNITFTGIPASLVNSNSSVINVVESNSGAASTLLAITSLTSTSEIAVSGFYYRT